MSLLGARAMVRLRYETAGAWGADGLRTEPPATESTIMATGPQPLNGVELATLPEAERHRDARKIYTAAPLRTLNQHTGIIADQIRIDGVTYEVRAVMQQPAIIAHYKALIVRLLEVDA